jgi:eukaryotic-like serine/threonine-protein kinase
MANRPPKKRPKPPPVKKSDGSHRLTITSFDPVMVDTCVPERNVSKRLERGPLLGIGGMGKVSATLDTNLNRVVALKELKPELANNQSLAGRLIIESQITAQLDHPNIVPVYELGTDRRGEVFFTMKLINGRTLSEILDLKPPDTRTAKDLFDGLQIFLKVCDAVAFAHAKGVIHKDLKPGNVMVGEYGEVYLMDWGFARLMGRSTVEIYPAPSKAKRRRQLKIDPRDGVVAATPHYLAPEFTSGEDFPGDERTDIFCLGGILYRILTGKPPFHGESMPEVARKALTSEVPPPEQLVVAEIPPRLSCIAMKALAKDPDDRYQTVMDLKEDVEQFLLSGWQFRRKRFRAGEVIIREGDPGDEAYIITSGTCIVYQGSSEEQIPLGEMRVGDVFGELAVFSGEPRTATVEAVTDVSLMVLEKHHFEEDLGMNFWLGVVLRSLAERFLEISTELRELKRNKT